jgi:hypothetical protein
MASNGAEFVLEKLESLREVLGMGERRGLGALRI